MVKIENAFGDVKRGKQGRAVYQTVYGKQVRRAHKQKKDAGTITQHNQRDRFRKGIEFWNSLSYSERQFLKSYMAEAGITAPGGLPTTLYSFVKRIAMTVPKVQMDVEAGEGGTGYYIAWPYYAPITLNNQTGGELTNFTVIVTLTPGTFSYAKCNEDGSDIRFSTADRTTPVSYLLEDWNYNGTSKVVVKVTTIPTGQNVCCNVHYGNESAESESTTNILELYDDFQNYSTNDPEEKGIWTVEAGTVTVETEGENKYLHLPTGSGKNWPTYDYLVKALCSLQAARWKFRCRVGTGGSGPSYSGGLQFLQQDASNWLAFQNGDNDSIAKCEGGAQSNILLLDDFIPTSWAEIEITRDQNGTITVHKNGEYVDDVTDAFTPSAGELKIWNGRTETMDFDDFRVMEFIDPEPTANIGAEKETETAATLKAFTIRHPAIASYELVGAGIKEEGLSDLDDHISTSVARAGLDVTATAIKVTTLDGQEHTFPVR